MRREPVVSDLFFQLDLRLNSEKGGDTSTYVTNGEWDLKGEPRHVVRPSVSSPVSTDYTAMSSSSQPGTFIRNLQSPA